MNVYIAYFSSVFQHRHLVKVFSDQTKALNWLRNIHATEGGRLDENHMWCRVPYVPVCDDDVGIDCEKTYWIETHAVE